LKPFVSVLLPAYNEEKVLKEVLESLIHQTYDNYEIIFVDNGSTDRTLDIARSVAEKSDKIKIHVYQSERVADIMTAKASLPRRYGMRRAKGVLILNFSSHAIASENLLETLVRECLRLNTVAVGCKEYLFRKTSLLSNVLYHLWFLMRRLHKKDGYVGNVCFAIFRRDVLEELCGTYPRSDYELNLLLSKAGYRKYFTTKTHVHYCATKNFKGIFKRLINYGNAKAMYCLEYGCKMSGYVLSAVLSFVFGYGLGFFLGLLGIDVRRRFGW